MTDSQMLQNATEFVSGMVGIAFLIAGARIGVAFVWAAVFATTDGPGRD